MFSSKITEQERDRASVTRGQNQVPIGTRMLFVLLSRNAWVSVGHIADKTDLMFLVSFATR